MHRKKVIAAIMILWCGIICFTGCGDRKEEADFSGLYAVCELTTLKCYYHNVAKAETEASGLFKGLNVGYKKIWTEYSGIVELGIDVSKVSISKPNAKGVVKITIPEAEVLNVYLDEDSMSEPITETGFLTKITKEEETAALAAAQENMKETARANQALLNQARERAKNIMEGYVKNVGEQIGKEYTVEWVDVR